MKNKKPILIIVLALVVIGAIVFFILTREIKPEPAPVQCASFCETNQVYAFCNVKITADKDTKATCQELSTKVGYSKFNVEKCSAISCDSLSNIDKTCVTGLGGTWVFLEDNKCPADPEGIRILRQLTPSDNPPVEGQVCCG
ncbi:hypothetical protein FJZ20_00750 [Candidatus Pacearchaeota archaeon]|nr:hypothetical protein [Candidatus Pacearchaeota archaeon]